MIGVKVKVVKPVVFCAKTGKQAVLEGDEGIIQGRVAIGSQMGVAVLFPEDSDVLDNGHIKQWSFLPHELEVVDSVVPDSSPISKDEEPEEVEDA